MTELKGYPTVPGSNAGTRAGNEIIVPVRLRIRAGVLSLFSTTRVFGSPLDITLSELAVETFFAADRATADLVRSLSA
jgi:hypothetical protein